MSDAEKKSEEKVIEKKIYAESRGKYTIVDGAKMFSFEFPSSSKLGENYDMLTYLREQVWVAMENQKKLEEESKKKKEEKKSEEVK